MARTWEMRPMKIVVDAMGGDHAPGVVIDGSVRAARELGVEVILVGPEDVVKREMARHGDISGLPVSVVHASQVVEMHEHTMAVKEKKDSSMNVGVKLVKEGQADAFMTAGNSGAGMAAALFGLGRIRGIERPAFCTIYPAAPNRCLLLDMGANTDPKPENLVQNALMGSLYAEHVMGIQKPRVGLVSNGEEPDKGSLLVRDAFKLLTASSLNFVGNVEGKDITRDKADVIVTDGFTGNVIVKLSEGILSFLLKYLKQQFTSGSLNKIALVLMLPGAILLLPGLLLMLPAALAIKRKMDWREYGAAPVLGVDGVVLIAHGRSDAKAIFGAIRATKGAVEGRVVEAIKEGLAAQKQSAAN
jgi:glycerol-3-phosphate acyltransferase PlsX